MGVEKIQGLSASTPWQSWGSRRDCRGGGMKNLVLACTGNGWVENVGGVRRKKWGGGLASCKSRFERFCNTFSSLSASSLWPMSWPRSVLKLVPQTLEGMTPVATRKRGH